MGRWAQRRRSGTSRTGPAAGAHITAVRRWTSDPSFVEVTFDTTLTAADAGSGNMQIDEGGSPEDAAIDTLASANVVRYGSYDPVSVGQTWTLTDAAGLHFTGGVSLLGPFTGTVLS